LRSFARKPAYVVLNGIPAGATVLTAEATRSAEGLGLQVCPVTLGDRAAFHRSAAKGEVASELEPEGKAAQEADALWQWVKAQLA